MDATQYAETDYITAELVKQAKIKKAVIIGEVKAEATDYGEKLTCPVEIDGKRKTYRPNKDTIKNLISALGSDTKAWLGKTLILNVISVMGKESVLGVVDKNVQAILK